VLVRAREGDLAVWTEPVTLGRARPDAPPVEVTVEIGD
jgi:hypothetical protein